MGKWLVVFGIISPIILAMVISCGFENPAYKPRDGTIRVEMVDASSGISQRILKSISAATIPYDGDRDVPDGDGATYSPVDLNSVKEILVTIERVEISEAEEGWKVITDVPQEYDLARMAKEGVKEILGEAQLAEGTYSQIRLILSEVNTITFTDGSTHDLFIPSGTETGVKLTGEFEVVGDETTTILLDFDTQESVVKRGIGEIAEYLLKPVIRILSVTR